ncbi:MAG: helix-turn-helix transcriptional regulator [Eubacteriales bacterium]|nr:helix-turn-helix transcriptional regulator [Eubacteriales bacterium]
MILADKIMEERKKNGWSQEELAEMLSISRQSVSKWESAQSTPDLQRIIRMAEIFGVSTDYLLRDEMEPKEPGLSEDWIQTKEETKLISVSMEEANDFMNSQRQNAGKVAAAVAMCILSPVILIVLAGLQEEKVIAVSEGMAAGIGIAVLLAMVAAAVFVLVTYSIGKSRFTYLENEEFETAYGVSGMVKEKERDFEPVYTRSIAIGVVLFITAVIPLVVAGAMEAPDYIAILGVAFLLCVVAAGVYLVVNACMIKGSYEILLQEGEHSRKEKKLRKKADPWSTIYWCAVTAVYLGWSFLTYRWDMTWIIWPVAGAGYGIIAAVLKITMHDKD